MTTDKMKEILSKLNRRVLCEDMTDYKALADVYERVYILASDIALDVIEQLNAQNRKIAEMNEKLKLIL